MISEGSTDALLGSDNLMTRSFDGRLSKVTLPDKTEIYTYKEKKATEELEVFTFNTVTVIYRPDGTVIRVQQDGDIVILSGEERQKINLKGQALERGQDLDYLFELNGKPEERRGGFYTINMQNSKIWTRDDENNVFEIHADGTAKCKLSVTLDLENNQKTIDEMVSISPRYESSTYIDPEAEYLEAPKNFIAPRLFVIENDNTGYELLTDNQIGNFKYSRSKDSHTKYYAQEVEECFLSHYWLTKHLPIKELIGETHYINNIKIPQKLEIITQTPATLKFPAKETYLYRNLIETRGFNQELRDKIALSVQAKDNWFAKRRNDFGIIDTAHIPELEENHKVQRRILMERQNSDMKFDYDMMKENIISPLFGMYDPYSILFNIEQYIDEKEQAKIIEDNHFRLLPLEIDSIKVEDVLATINEDGESVKNFKKKRIQALFTEVKAMQEIKFVDNYYVTDAGKEFVQMNPRRFYIKKKKEEQNIAVEEYEGNAVLTQGDNFNQKQVTPIIYLDNEKPSKEQDKTLKNSNKPLLQSIYKRKKQLFLDKSEKERMNAEQWHHQKSYEYNHDCSPRQQNPLVPKYLKTTFPEAEFNEDHIAVEKLTEKRLRTVSVAKRLYFNAPSVNQMRKYGQHNFIGDALTQKKTYEEMMEKVNLMVTSELCDPHNKMLKVIMTLILG